MAMKFILLMLGLLILFVTAGCQTGQQPGVGLGEAPGYPYVYRPYN